MTTRDKYAKNIARSFDFESKPDYEVPDLPDPSTVVASSCTTAAPLASAASASSISPVGGALQSLGAVDVMARPKEHDLATLKTSGWLERLGFDYVPATPARTFRHPSKLGLKP